MKYLLSIYESEAAWESLPEAEQEKAFGECMGLSADPRSSGKYAPSPPRPRTLTPREKMVTASNSGPISRIPNAASTFDVTSGGEGRSDPATNPRSRARPADAIQFVENSKLSPFSGRA